MGKAAIRLLSGACTIFVGVGRVRVESSICVAGAVRVWVGNHGCGAGAGSVPGLCCGCGAVAGLSLWVRVGCKFIFAGAVWVWVLKFYTRRALMGIRVGRCCTYFPSPTVGRGEANV